VAVRAHAVDQVLPRRRAQRVGQLRRPLVEAGKGDKPAIIFEGDSGDNRIYTFAQLKDEVSKFANVLKKHGVKKGDRVALYLPMLAELPAVMLACARIGAIHMWCSAASRPRH